MKRICVFCGSSSGNRPEYQESAIIIGRLLAIQGIGLIYGGGNVGLMGALADSAMSAGGEVIGIIPDALLSKEVGHRGISELRVVGSMHERKAMMAEISDGFLALPGGFGTFEELCEIVTWAQLGMHRKPCAILNVSGYYDPLLALIDHAQIEGFIRPKHHDLLLVDTDPERIIQTMLNYQGPELDPWISKSKI